MSFNFSLGFGTNRRRSKPDTQPVGFPGTVIYGGFINEEENNSKLTGTEKYKTFANILANTSIVAAGTRFYLNIVSKPAWTFEPADESEQSKLIADNITFLLSNMDTPMHRVVRRMAMYKFYGFSTQAWHTVRHDNGLIGFKDIAPRPQVTITGWDRDEAGELIGVVQRSPQTYEEDYIPRDRLVYIVDDSLTDSPAGLGIFRHLVEPCSRLQRFEQLEGYGFETDLRGTPVGRAPLQQLMILEGQDVITKEQRIELITPLQNFLTDHVKTPSLSLLLDSMTYESQDEAATPSSQKMWDMEVLTSASTAQPDIARAIERLNQEIARIMSIEGMLLGATNYGSQALSVDKSTNFGLVVESALTEIKEVIERDVIAKLMRLNGWDPALTPTVNVESVQYRDASKVVAVLRELALAGAPLPPDDPAINAVRKLVGLPEQSPMSDIDIDLSAFGFNNQNNSDDQESENGSDTRDE